MQKQFLKLFFLLAIFLIVPNFANALVVFETNFDSNANWSAANGMECSYLPGGNNASGVSNTANVGGTCNNPTNWEGYRSQPTSGQTHPTVAISAMPSGSDKTGSGKAMVVYNKGTGDTGVYSSDGILAKFFHGQNYQDLYVRYWYRTQAGYAYTNPTQHKTFRIGHARMNDDPSGAMGNCNYEANAWNMKIWSPTFFLDLGNQAGNLVRYEAYRCDKTPYDTNLGTSCGASNDYYCANQSLPGGYPAGFNTTDYYYPMTGVPNLLDGSWHRVDQRFKLNTAGSTNGIYTLSVDGTEVINRTTVMWKTSTAFSGAGWNTMMFGGNNNGSQAEQWYAFDDIVVSTTEIPYPYTIGGSDTTAPSAPSGLSVL